MKYLIITKNDINKLDLFLMSPFKFTCLRSEFLENNDELILLAEKISNDFEKCKLIWVSKNTFDSLDKDLILM